MAGTDTQTYASVGTGAESIVLPTNPDTYIMIKSHKTNTGNIWFSEKNTPATGVPIAASIDGDDNAIIEPGESVLVRRPGPSGSVLTTIAAQKYTISNARNRVR